MTHAVPPEHPTECSVATLVGDSANTGMVTWIGVPPVGDWRADAVSKWVNVAGHDDPKCIAPPDDDSPQRSLF